MLQFSTATSLFHFLSSHVFHLFSFRVNLVNLDGLDKRYYLEMFSFPFLLDLW